MDPAALPVASWLGRFGQVLRAVGVPVTTSELMAGAAALCLVDVQDRRQVRLALSCTLAKDPGARDRFASVFERLFPDGDPAGPDRPEAPPGRGQPGPGGHEPLRLWDRPVDLSPGQAQAYAGLSPAQRRRLQEFLAQTAGEGGLDSSFRPLVEHVIRDHLDRWGPGRSPLLARSTGEDALDALAAGIIAASGPVQEPLLTLDMGSIRAEDLERARGLVRKLAQRLATRVLRRYQARRRAQRLDFRRTIRANTRYGSALLRLRYASPRIGKPRLVLICDVSGSMSRHAGFILQFAHGLGRVTRELEVFLFAEDLEPISRPVRAWRGSHADYARLVESSPVWGRGTNLARALRRLLDEHPAALAPDATVLIVSDAKTLAVSEAAGLVREIRGRVRQVMWLNPVPAEQWARTPAVSVFRQRAAMYPCSTLAELEQVLSQAFGPRPARPAGGIRR